MRGDPVPLPRNLSPRTCNLHFPTVAKRGNWAFWGAVTGPEVAASSFVYSILSKVSHGSHWYPPSRIGLIDLNDLAEELELFLRGHVEASEAARDACPAPTDQRWTWILRQDN